MKLKPKPPFDFEVEDLSVPDAGREEALAVVPALGIGAGRPACFVGDRNSLKTLSVQSLALSVASGQKLWGLHEVRKGRVLHLDYEQGTKLTRGRYDRLARGAGIDLRSLPDSLFLASYPGFFVDDGISSTGYKRLVSACEGCDLLIVDSFNAACPSADESKSDLRAYVDRFSRISDTTGVAIVFVLRTGRPSSGDLRGSSGLWDACGSVLAMGADKGRPTVVFHAKNALTGRTVPDFGLVAEDVAMATDPRGGLRLLHLDVEQDASLETNQDRILAVFRRKRRVYRGTKDNLRSDVKMGKSSFASAFATLLEDGKILQHSDTHFVLADGL